MTLVLIHGGIIAALLAAGWLFPRVQRADAWRHTALNLFTGGSLALARMGLASLLVGWSATRGGLIDLCHVRIPLVQFLVVFLISDFARYWVHYCHHRFPALWRFHRVHHSSEHLDASSGLRMHWVDFVQLTLIPVMLFAVVFDVSTFAGWVWPALVVTTDLFDAIGHANVGMTLEHPLAAAWGRAFNNPVFHSWHHSTDPSAYNSNYGQALTIWDRIFNTTLDRPDPAMEFGLPEDEALDTSWLGLQRLRPAPRQGQAARLQ